MEAKELLLTVEQVGGRDEVVVPETAPKPRGGTTRGLQPKYRSTPQPPPPDDYSDSSGGLYPAQFLQEPLYAYPPDLFYSAYADSRPYSSSSSSCSSSTEGSTEQQQLQNHMFAPCGQQTAADQFGGLACSFGSGGFPQQQQPGYTSVIVDTQQYQLANEYVRPLLVAVQCVDRMSAFESHQLLASVCLQDRDSGLSQPARQQLNSTVHTSSCKINVFVPPT